MNELRAHLEAKLPEYMVPSVFAEIEAFPLTPAGKVDRRSLPSPVADRPSLEECFAAPETQMEQEIAELWRNLLGLDEIGIHDDFFNLGGDSLLVVHFVSQARERLGVEIRVGRVFESPTVEALAEHVEGIRLLSEDFEENLEVAGSEREEIQI